MLLKNKMVKGIFVLCECCGASDEGDFRSRLLALPLTLRSEQGLTCLAFLRESS